MVSTYTPPRIVLTSAEGGASALAQRGYSPERAGAWDGYMSWASGLLPDSATLLVYAYTTHSTTSLD